MLADKKNRRVASGHCDFLFHGVTIAEQLDFHTGRVLGSNPVRCSADDQPISRYCIGEDFPQNCDWPNDHAIADTGDLDADFFRITILRIERPEKIAFDGFSHRQEIEEIFHATIEDGCKAEGYRSGGQVAISFNGTDRLARNPGSRGQRRLRDPFLGSEASESVFNIRGRFSFTSFAHDCRYHL
jgi:hypothetical protein